MGRVRDSVDGKLPSGDIRGRGSLLKVLIGFLLKADLDIKDEELDQMSRVGKFSLD